MHVGRGSGDRRVEAGKRRSHSLTMLLLVNATLRRDMKITYPSEDPPEARMPGIACSAIRLVTDLTAVLCFSLAPILVPEGNSLLFRHVSTHHHVLDGQPSPDQGYSNPVEPQTQAHLRYIVLSTIALERKQKTRTHRGTSGLDNVNRKSGCCHLGCMKPRCWKRQMDRYAIVRDRRRQRF